MPELTPISLSSTPATTVAHANINVPLGKDFNYPLSFNQPTLSPPNFNKANFTIVSAQRDSASVFAPTLKTFYGLPGGVGIDGNGVMFGKPSAPGSYKIDFFQGGQSNGTVYLNVGKADPVLVTKKVFGSPTAAFNTVFSFQIGPNFNTGQVVTSFDLPAGLFIQNNTLAGTHPTPGTYSASVVIGGGAASFSEKILIYIFAAAPEIFTSTLPTAKVGQPYEAELFLADANSPADSWSVTGLAPGLSFANGKITGTPTESGTFSQVFTVTNPIGSTSKTLSLSVALGAPLIISDSLSAEIGEPFSGQVLLDNEARRPVTSWEASGLPIWATINTSTGEITGTPDAASKSTITISATGAGGATAKEVILIARQKITGKVGDALSATPSLLETGTATQWAATGLPAGLAINTTTGAITGTPEASGGFLATVEFTLATGTITRQIDFDIAFGAPIILLDQTLAAALNVAFSKAPELSSPAHRPVTSWAATGLPEWASINTATGEITGTPTADHSVITATITATGPGGSVSQAVNFDVAGGTPIIVGNQSFTGKVGVVFSPVIPATVDSANRPVASWAALGLPSGLSINAATGQITGTPTSYGTYKTLITATGENAAVSTASITFEIAIGAPLVRVNQSFISKYGTPFSRKIIADTVTQHPITSWAATGLPDWATLDQTGQITGTPTAIGTTAITVTATGPGGTTTQALNISVTAGLPKLTAGQSFSGIVNAAVTFQLEADDAANRLITNWSCSNLPTGLTISATTGEITGIPVTFWNATATITLTGPGGISYEQVAFSISRLPATSSVKIYSNGRFPIQVAGSRRVQVFGTGLVLVTVEYLVPLVDEEKYAPQFKAGLPLIADSPAVDGLVIYPEPSREDTGNGFVKYNVSAYGRASQEWKITEKVVGLGANQFFLQKTIRVGETVLAGFPANIKNILSINTQNFGQFNEIEIVAQ